MLVLYMIKCSKLHSFYLVYENSEDIAMTSNADNVYSNTNYNAKNDQEQRGYKVHNVGSMQFNLLCFLMQRFS